MSKVVLAVGTRKGLFLLESDAQRDKWQQHGPFLNGDDVNHATTDIRTGTIYATANNPWFGGNRVARSTDSGKTWQNGANNPKFPEGREKSVEKLWRIQPGRDSEPRVIYLGGDPGCLFRSDDGGDTWTENEALTNHPTREGWFPGAGGLITHSIVLDPANRDRMWLAISAAGVFRSEDGGKSWQPANSSLKNVLAKYEPNANMYPEVGQCVHHLTHAANSDRLYAQTHWGTYRSDDGAVTWTEITEGLPSDFGMVMAAHPSNSDVAYVVPLQGAEFRCPPEGKLRVYRTSDAGKSWQPMTKGLPQEGAYMGIYREAMCTDTLPQAGVYFGTNTGHVYASADEGESWRRITTDLPPVSSVSAAVLE